MYTIIIAHSTLINLIIIVILVLSIYVKNHKGALPPRMHHGRNEYLLHGKEFPEEEEENRNLFSIAGPGIQDNTSIFTKMVNQENLWQTITMLKHCYDL